MKSHIAILLETPSGEVMLREREDEANILDPGKISAYVGELKEGESPAEAAFRELKDKFMINASEIEMQGFCDYQNITDSREEEGRKRCYVFLAKDVDPWKIAAIEGKEYILVSKKDNLDYLNLTLFTRDILRKYFGK